MNKKFLKHSSPFEYESLYSYIIRLAEENSTPLEWILDELHLRSSVFPNNLYYLDNNIIRNISYISSQEENIIRKMTISGFFSEQSNKIGSDFNYIISTNNTSKFCPLCLKEHKYQRIYWQFPMLEVCLKHNTVLLSQCPTCKATITSQMIMDGRCSCGALLDNAKALNCDAPEILQLNKSLYDAYGLYCTNKGKFFKGLTGIKYIAFIQSLLELIKKYQGMLYEIKTLSYYDYKKFPTLYPYYIINKIINDWPNSLFLVFDYINGFWSRSNKDKFTGCNNIFNPIYAIYTEIQKYLKHNKQFIFIDKIMWQYFLERYNHCYFEKNYKYLLKDKYYLPINCVNNLFNIDNCNSRKFFSVYTIDENDCVKIHDVFKLIAGILKKSELYNYNNDYINIEKLIKIFEPFNISLYDILKIIKNTKGPFMIDPFSNFGIFMIWLPEKEIMLKLLKLAIKKFDS